MGTMPDASSPHTRDRSEASGPNGTEPAGRSGTGSPRTLAEALRAGGDEGLAALLRARPDLLTPVPTDLTQLATRAATRASVVRALERLDRFTLQTAEALAVAPDPAPYDTLLALLGGDDGDPSVAAALPDAVAVLRRQALTWGGDDRLRLVRTARELLAPSPARPSPTGLGPTVAEATSGMSPGRLQEILAAAGLPATHDPVSAVAALTELFTDRTRMSLLLDAAPPEALAVLDRLVWGPPYGEVTADPAPPVRWLRDRGLLLPASPRTVVLPREAALHLRAGRAHRVPEPAPPAVEAGAEHRPQVVDGTAAGQAFTALSTVEELLKEWHEGGPAVLRAGGLSVRDLKRTAVALDAPEPLAAFWLELAYGAGLLASDGEADERYAPTPAYDEWLELPAADRWARLAATWLAATRTPGLVGTQDAKGRTLSALGPDLDRSAAPEVRRRVLELLAGLPAGTAPDPDTVLARLRWERPLRGGGPQSPTTPRQPDAQRPTHPQGPAPTPQAPDLRSLLASWTLKEAELLGFTGRGALATHARVLLGPGLPPAHGGVPDAPEARADTAGPSGFRRAAPTGTAADETGAGAAPVAGPATPPGTGKDGTGTGAPADTYAPGGAAAPDPDADAADPAAAPGGAEPAAGFGAADPAAGPAADADAADPAAAPGGAEPAAAPGSASAEGSGRALTGRGDAPAHPAPVPADPGTLLALAADALAPLLPQPLDHVLLQADLTAVAPGPLQRPLAETLSVLADVESKGGATVYRFTPGSVRRALDAGKSASDLHAFLAAHSRTPVPQPLSYLIDDVARRHGHLRIGAAGAYVRCDDDALLGEILADRRSAGLRLRRLAPTVLAAQADPAALLEALRSMGYAPAAESAEGDVLITRAHARRTPPRTPPAPVPDGPPLPDDALLTSAVRAIRAGDLAATVVRKPAPEPQRPLRTGELPRTTSAETLATVQAAALTGSAVWIGYVNADGAASQRVVAPVRVEGGFVTAYDHTADEVRTFALHRITGVAELAEESS
ncbi:helicase C-terminal domain-containing protein [Streptomyces sp. HNM0663]|uniref:Helicase C-terminal domain-containing protein n=1 Tax=Streptomyces chengmaiensis TaxID=3040919 RepID=A0ABT6HLQ4_9ACTN|nr:helicase C-terminal domain-containing protein [Streptomyces chengmaiensis]MDH2389652.1 helicase C-terminal domain-containing protein [Streptomyces chengmaiensis]